MSSQTEKEPFDQRKCTPEEREVFMAIQQAVLQAAPKTIHFTYTKIDGTNTERYVEPYEVIGGKNPQVVVHDIDKDSTRRFLLSGMSNVREGESYNARHPIRIALG